MKEKIIIFGIGETADILHYYLTHDSNFEVVGFTVDRAYLRGDAHRGLPVVAFEDAPSSFPPSEFGMLIAVSYVGLNSVRAEKYAQAKAKGYRLVNFVNSRAITWPGLVMGDNCHVDEGCIIEPFAQIGNDVSIASGSQISHHCTIKDHCFIAAHVVICGGVTVEPFCFIGANATIRDGLVIARECVIGAGAVILENTRERGVYKAHPATLLPKSSDALRSI